MISRTSVYLLREGPPPRVDFLVPVSDDFSEYKRGNRIRYRNLGEYIIIS